MKQHMKSQNTNQNIFIVLLVLFLGIAESKAQYFSSDYFAPVQLSKQQRSNNSFFYGSYGSYMSTDIEDLLDVGGINENELSVVWFKNTRPGTKKGFEIMFKHNKRNVDYYSYSDYRNLNFQLKYSSLKISTVGTKGVAWSLLGTKFSSQLTDSYGGGIEMTVGGHPMLTAKKHKWPFAWTLGAQTLLSEPGDGLNIYTNLSLQHFVCKQRPGWYFRLDIGGGIDNNYIWYGTSGFYVRAGASTGLVF